jgi:dTDP-glucose pyrophosphorylase
MTVRKGIIQAGGWGIRLHPLRDGIEATAFYLLQQEPPWRVLV